MLSATSPNADFSGDQFVGTVDLDLLQANFGTATGAARHEGDADNDADVDGSDFLAWQRQFNTSVAAPIEADFDDNKNVNATDLALWQQGFAATNPSHASSVCGNNHKGQIANCIIFVRRHITIYSTVNLGGGDGF